MNSTPLDTYAGHCIHGVPYGPGWSCGWCTNPTAAISKTISPTQTICGGCAALTGEALVLIGKRVEAEAEATRLRARAEAAETEAARLRGQLEADDAKLAEREEEIEKLREALLGMVHQFAYWSDEAGGYMTGGLSALEDAFEALRWSDPRPEPEDRCEAPGCMKQRSSGMPTPDGYRWLCVEHWLAGRAAR